MDLAVLRLMSDEVFQKGDKLSARVPARGLAQDFSRLGVESGIQGKRSMPEVLESVALDPAWRKGQDRVEPIQSLDGGLLIDTEDGSVLRRFEVEAQDVSGLGLKVRIVRGHVPFH